jgi:hypothetical protein
LQKSNDKSACTKREACAHFLCCARPAIGRKGCGFRHTGNGVAILIPHAAYGPADASFEAEGHYHCFNTCNCWTGAALRSAGISRKYAFDQQTILSLMDDRQEGG